MKPASAETWAATIVKDNSLSDTAQSVALALSALADWRKHTVSMANTVATLCRLTNADAPQVSDAIEELRGKYLVNTPKSIVVLRMVLPGVYAPGPRYTAVWHDRAGYYAGRNKVAGEARLMLAAIRNMPSESEDVPPGHIPFARGELRTLLGMSRQSTDRLISTVASRSEWLRGASMATCLIVDTQLFGQKAARDKTNGVGTLCPGHADMADRRMAA